METVNPPCRAVQVVTRSDGRRHVVDAERVAMDVANFGVNNVPTFLDAFAVMKLSVQNVPRIRNLL